MRPSKSYFTTWSRPILGPDTSPVPFSAHRENLIDPSADMVGGLVMAEEFCDFRFQSSNEFRG